MCGAASFFFAFAHIARPYSVNMPATRSFVFWSDGSLGLRLPTRFAAFLASAMTSASVASPAR
jgi:hypothetical protein